MRLLVIGGTRFIGRHLVGAALEHGHDVTLFHRGTTGLELFPSAEHRLGDRNLDLSALGRGEWDATIDMCGFLPRQVDTLADVLDGRGGHHVFVSSVAVYDDLDGPGAIESAPLARLTDGPTETVSDETYGPLKALSEQAARLRHPSGALVVRPTYVIGPDDVSWRFPWWVMRIARGGEVLAPGPRDDPAQYVDVRDLTAWMLRLIEDRTVGTFHAAAPSTEFTWEDELEAVVREVGPPGTRLRWVDADVLLDAGLDDNDLPLWARGAPERWSLAVDCTAAVRSGLRCRPLAETIRDVHAWASGRAAPSTPGLGDARAQELLDR